MAETAPMSFVDYVKAPAKDEPYARNCETAATTLVAGLIGKATVTDELRRQAIWTTGANLYQRRQRLMELRAPDGSVQYTPDRPTRDPLDAARHLLADALGPGIA